MYARLFEGSLRAGASGDATNYFRQSLVPALRQQPGFLNGRLLTDAATGHCLLITVWESEADRRGADANGVLQTLFGHWQQYFVQPPIWVDYDLAAQVH